MFETVKISWRNVKQYSTSQYRTVRKIHARYLLFLTTAVTVESRAESSCLVNVFGWL
jgi:hypothetical protein